MDGSKNVFIIDNSSSVRKSLSRLLRIAGFNVKSFTSAVDFLNVFETGMLGCLILDMSMLGMFGEELVEELKRQENSLKIIVISTNDDQKTKKMANDMGAIGFFRKPVDGYALIDSINWTLKNNLFFDNH
jgi:FixJ family two-component response regulator